MTREKGKVKRKDAKKRDWFGALCDDIASLRIQGAENVARAAAKGVARRIKEEGKLLARDQERLLSTRPTEPMMRNAVRYLAAHATPKNADSVLQHLLLRFDEADTDIAHYAANLVKDGKTYFTHCHSSTVIRAFMDARTSGRRFTIHNTETRPLFQGRTTATELAAAGIPVIHGVDSAARVLLKGCSAVFLGADALLSDGKVANKIGSEMVAELADARRIPVYVLASSWKHVRAGSASFKEQLETRSATEVWSGAPKRVRVENLAFEFIEPRFITAVVTERGIRDPLTCAREFARHIVDKNV